MNIAIFTATWMIGMIPIGIGMVVGGIGGILMDGIAIHGIMIITITNVVVGIVRHPIMVKVPLISILGGGSDLSLVRGLPLLRRSNYGRS